MAFTGSAALRHDWDHFDLDVSGGVATITFNRPERLNALTFEVYADLRDLFSELPRHDDVDVVVLTGTGRGFCSGGDVHDIIGALQGMDARSRLDFTRMTGTVVQRMRDCPKPVIAAVNGVAAGAGAVLALAADIRIMAASARLALLFTKVGLSGADMGVAYLLPRLVGLSRATSLLLLGDDIDAATCADYGLAYEVVADDELPARTTALARRLAEGPTFAYATTKMLLARELDTDLAGAIELEAFAQALLMSTADHAEFYAAFRDKRAPRWEGR